ncbi:hypothetical protein MKW92_049025 [Papaver armeniacum]|nr:hypothetical protein MKW92_049025 [Papaver armeniacum]
MDRPVILLDHGWGLMQTGITKLIKILEGLPEPQFNSDSYMMLYTTCYNMCTQKPPHDYSQQLYEKYKEAFENYINETVLPSLREKHDEFLLRELEKRWINHKIMVRWLSRFFFYLDRYFIARRSLPPLNDVGLLCFRKLVYEEINVRAREAVISLINQEREGEQIDRALLKNVLAIFVDIGMVNMEYYVNDFEAELLSDTAGYYTRKASNWIQEDSCPEYMIKAEECLKREKDRVSHYLHSSTEEKLIEQVQEQLLSKVSQQLLEKEHSGCYALLREDKTEDLTRMYNLFSKIPKGLDPVSLMFKQHVTSEGIAVVNQAEDAANSRKENRNVSGSQEQMFIRKVIDLHEKYMLYVTTCFAGHTLFHKALKEAFEVFCNKVIAGSSSAELLSNFSDNILKKGGSENWMMMSLRIHLTRKKLARRLLFGTSANDDHERSILSKLKQQCGGQFTSKMEGMVKCVEVFKEFYQTKTKHRKLTWQYSLGTCNVVGKFQKKPIELVVTTYQASLLLLFNLSDKLTYSEILSQLNLSDDDVVRLLHSLSCAKYKILAKEPNTKTISQKDSFMFNAEFTDKMRRIKVPLPPVDEKKKVIEDVDKDRRYAIDASIVRIMKSRKVLPYHQLLSECVDQLNRMFKPDFKIIKKRIEDLITRDYLERDKDNPNTFRYLA